MADENNVEFLDTMNEIVIDFGRICRFCLAETESCISILDKCLPDDSFKFCRDTISDFVTRMTCIEMNDLQNFPSFVCENCYDLINICYNFSVACQESDLSLRNCYQRTFNKAKENLNFKDSDTEIIADDELMWKTKLKLVKENSVAENVILKLNQIDLNTHKSYENEIKDEMKWKARLGQDVSISIRKPDSIKAKCQRINSLSERLMEAQSKLTEDIVQLKSEAVEGEERDSLQSKSVNCSCSCPRCSFDCNNREVLKHHYMMNHSEIKQVKSSVKFQCKKCIKTFSEQKKLLKHYENIHNLSKCIEEDTKLMEGGERKFHCLHCDSHQVFFSRDQSLHQLEGNHKEGEKIFDEAHECGHEERDETIGKKGTESMGRREEKSNLNLFKVFVCTDCFPPVSFANVETCLKHKVESHGKQEDSILPREMAAVYVDSLDVFKQSKEENEENGFKVVCKNCRPPVEFETANDFVNHMNSEHDESTMENWKIERKGSTNEGEESKGETRQNWRCSDCPAVYHRKHSLRFHMREKHEKGIDSREMKCPDCDESFLTNRRLIRHGISIHQKYFAQHHKVFERKILRGRGNENETKMKNFECDICQRKYACKNSLKRHILKSHLGRVKTESVVCSYCGKTLSSKFNLKSHVEFVHEALFVSCPICKKKINLKTIGKHYETHRDDSDGLGSGSRFLCNLCGKTLKSKRSFDDHQKLHKNVRDQLCDVCGTGFTTKKFLQVHKKIHEGGGKRKVFGCPQCEKVFSGRHTLNRHLLTHSGEKNFVCEMCSKSFYTLQELNRHVRCHKKEYRFDCQLCEMRFLDKSRFRHHMMRHRNVRPHKCLFCDKMFIVRRKMNLHMAAKHNVEVESTKAVWKDPKTYVPLDDLL